MEVKKKIFERISKEDEIYVDSYFDVMTKQTQEEKDKIPVNLRRFITDNCDRNHKVDINKLNKRTQALLAVIYRKYLCENPAEAEQEHQTRLREERILRMVENQSVNTQKRNIPKTNN